MAAPRHPARQQGTDNASAQLTPTQVREIRSLARESYSYVFLASKFGVTEGTIRAIVKYRTWRNI